MLTATGKTLLVLVTFLSIAFMGTAIALQMTSPPFRQQAAALDDYGVTVNPSTETSPLTYTATRLADDKEVVTSPSMPDVLAAIYRDREAELTARLAEIDERKRFYETQQQLLEATIEPDRAAMEQKVASLRDRVTELRTRRQQVGVQIGQRQEEIEASLRLAEARRDDVFRVEATLAQVAADGERVRQLRQQLDDLIAQIDADLVKVRRREAQLRDQLSGDAIAPAPIEGVGPSFGPEPGDEEIENSAPRAPTLELPEL